MKRIFISYSHRDEALRAELEKHLTLLKRQGVVDIWTDHCIQPGEDINASISEGLEQADIFLLLISVDFLASDYCYGIEMERALERQRNKEATVVAIILRPCDWESAPFKNLKLLPTDGLPITNWKSLDDGFLNVVKHLRELLKPEEDNGHPKHQPSRNTNNESSSSEKLPNPAIQKITGRSENLSVALKITDEVRHDFIQDAFEFIREYFMASLDELQRKYSGISFRASNTSATGFTAVIFQDGQRQTGAFIRIGGLFTTNSIGYSNNERATDGSYNEILTAESSREALYLKPTMAIFNRAKEEKLTKQEAAEHLWSLFISPLQHRH